MPQLGHAHVRGFWVAVALAVAAFALVGVAAAAGVGVRVDAGLRAHFTALADAYPGERPVAVDGDADLRLHAGAVDGRALDTVVVAPGAALTRQVDGAAARDFQRFATSPDGQRALIGAGLLPATVTDHATRRGGRGHRRPAVERVASPYSLATYLAYGVGAGDRVVAAGFLGAATPTASPR
jgi:hypothetical protein